MPILLPETPGAVDQTFELVTAKNVLTPAIGGAEQELLRKGTRNEIGFTLPPLDDLEAMDWADLTIEGDTVVMTVLQPSLVIGNPGAPLVNGAGAIGASLPVKGLTPGYTIRKGQWLTHLTNSGQRFLYRASAAVTANGSGVAAVPIYGLLRRSPLNNEVIEIAKPRIEGFVRDLGKITIGVDRLVVLSFKIRERE